VREIQFASSNVTYLNQSMYYITLNVSMCVK